MIGSCRGTRAFDDAEMTAVQRDRLIHHSHIAGKYNVSKDSAGWLLSLRGNRHAPGQR
jgi:hypothetical protein